MTDYRTNVGAGLGSRAAVIDEGLRAHMNKVYGLMSVGMLVTGGVAWAVGSSPALLGIFRDPLTLQPNILGWIVMFAPVIAAIFIFLGLRRPYVRLKMLAKKRAEGLRNNMLIGLSVLSSLLSSGVGVQEALRRASTVGGPFCNLLGLLVARMEVEDFNKAIEVTRAHLPDAADVEANLFLRDI